MDEEGLELSLAKVMNGPWDFQDIFKKPNNQKYTLQEMRDVKWGQLTNREQATLRMQARSVIKHLRENEMTLGMIAEGFKDG